MISLRMKNKLISAVAGIMLMVLVAACAPKDEKKKEQIFAVNGMPAVKGELIDYLEVNGDIEASSSVSIYPETNGEIVSVNVNLGQYVTEGQIIVRVDPSRPGQRFIPNPVRAPISGTITSLPIRIGAKVSVTGSVAQIAQTKNLVIATDIAERFVARMKTGLAAEVRLEAYPDEVFAAKITEVSPVIDPVSRSMTVKLVFTGNTNKIKAGMFSEVRIITEKKENIIKIPFQSIIRIDNKTYVFVEKDLPVETVENSNNDTDGNSANNQQDTNRKQATGIAEKREVVTGLIIDNKVEITSGLNEGEIVIVQGQKSLDDQSKIRMITSLPGLPVNDEIGGGIQ